LDFTALRPAQSITRQLFFDATAFPGLRGCAGDYIFKVFYTNSQDGHGLEMDIPVWTGAVVSGEVPFCFAKRP